VLDANGKALNRYDEAPKPAQAGDAVAARLVTSALQQAVSSGTGRQLMSDGLGRLQPAGKTGTSNDSRDSWYAGFTGDHLAVIWVGNDKNEPTGLYGATGAMKVWSALFRKLPTRALNVGSEGIEWAWLDASEYATTEEGCPGARRAAFVSGYLPPEHKTCQESSWLDWFRLGSETPPAEQAPPAPPPSADEAPTP
jgi:penicillin-binding protein 1B